MRFLGQWAASIATVSEPAADPTAPLIIVNPRAARLHEPARRAEIVEAVARAVLARTGQNPIVVSGDLTESDAALRTAAGASLVVVVGGDGTISRTAEALAGRSTDVAIVPGGTGNVLAASLRIGGIGPALEIIRRGVARRIDLGEAHWGPAGESASTGSSIFLVACGMGLDARIMAAAEHEWKRKMRFGAYVGATLKTLPQVRPVAFRIEADGERLDTRGYVVLVANTGELVPGRLGPRRRIDPSDGRLDLIVVGGANPIAGLHATARLLVERGELSDGPIRRTVERVRIESDPPEPIEVDGDHQPPGWLEVRVLPGALDVLTPDGGNRR
jgi:diacylglycerol kinase (ATP)